MACDVRAANDDCQFNESATQRNYLCIAFTILFFSDSFVFDLQRHTLSYDEASDHDHVANVCLLFFVFLALHCLSYDRSKYSIHTFLFFSRERLNFFLSPSHQWREANKINWHNNHIRWAQRVKERREGKNPFKIHSANVFVFASPSVPFKL